MKTLLLKKITFFLTLSIISTLGHTAPQIDDTLQAELLDTLQNLQGVSSEVSNTLSQATRVKIDAVEDLTLDVVKVTFRVKLLNLNTMQETLLHGIICLTYDGTHFDLVLPEMTGNVLRLDKISGTSKLNIISVVQ